MKNIQLVISSFLCVFINISFENKVQAKNNEIIPLNSFFGSWERRHIQELRDTQVHQRDPTESIEQEKTEFEEFRKRRQKKNKKVSKNKKALSSKNTIKLTQKKNQRKKRRKDKSNRRFVKTTLNDVLTDSKMSNSKESDGKGKPVDIIVHIKMND
ncbi:uncharacterized protein LOC120634330 [Pararge aegeria]|uniref:uncharacterized protein LOC120634330 n=1 Tax=Pararge aegeria TaxID=116150 RepID=UPI0019D2BBF6|nr:uncharacterized protein LOC120634330 [Pararge aegeria]